jgi:hypothetical protein
MFAGLGESRVAVAANPQDISWVLGPDSGPGALPGKPAGQKLESVWRLSLLTQMHCFSSGLLIHACYALLSIKLHTEKRAARKKMQAARCRIEGWRTISFGAETRCWFRVQLPSPVRQDRVFSLEKLARCTACTCGVESC